MCKQIFFVLIFETYAWTRSVVHEPTGPVKSNWALLLELTTEPELQSDGAVAETSICVDNGAIVVIEGAPLFCTRTVPCPEASETTSPLMGTILETAPAGATVSFRVNWRFAGVAGWPPIVSVAWT
jgi:hypothetical protein